MPDYRLLVKKLEDLKRLESRKAYYPTQGRKLEPRLDERAVHAFEVRHGIRLPEEYRDFLLQVGNGGPGPLSSEPLRKLDTTAHHSGIADPFPYADGWCRDSEVPLELDYQRGRIKIDLPGTLDLGCEGCTVWVHLVVTGSARGQIWLKDLSDHLAMWPIGELCPYHLGELSATELESVKRESRRYNFFELYDKWLDDSLAEVRKFASKREKGAKDER